MLGKSVVFTQMASIKRHYQFDCVTHPNQFVVLSTRFVYNSTEGLLKFQCMKCVTNISVRKTLYMCDSICTKKVGRDNLNWWSINMISNLNHFWYVVRSILSMKCNEIRRDEYFISELDRTSGPGAQSYAYPLTQKHPYIFCHSNWMSFKNKHTVSEQQTTHFECVFVRFSYANSLDWQERKYILPIPIFPNTKNWEKKRERVRCKAIMWHKTRIWFSRSSYPNKLFPRQQTKWYFDVI